MFLAFGLEEDAYKLGLTKVFFRPGKQEWLEDVLGNNPELSPEMLAKIRSLIFRKRFRRLRGAVLLLTRFQMLYVCFCSSAILFAIELCVFFASCL